jgi:drug/metabolite transporter superfamily protein YnfA
VKIAFKILTRIILSKTMSIPLRREDMVFFLVAGSNETNVSLIFAPSFIRYSASIDASRSFIAYSGIWIVRSIISSDR